MGLTESWQAVKDAHAAEYPDSIFADSLALVPAGPDEGYEASMSVPEGRVQAYGQTPETELDALALDLAGVEKGDARRAAI